jgi:hypothetical protein
MERGDIPAGVHYLDHGEYPPGHWDKRRRGQPVALHVAACTPMVAPRCPVAGERPTTERPAKKPPTDELTPTRKLLKDIVDAGGILEIDTRDDKASYRPKPTAPFGIEELPELSRQIAVQSGVISQCVEVGSYLAAVAAHSHRYTPITRTLEIIEPLPVRR